MAGFKITAFRGRYPGIESRNLATNAATVASDLKLGYGDIRPLHGYLSQAYPLIDRGAPQALFRYQDEWLHFGVPTSFATAPSGQDAWNRVVFTHDEYEEDEEIAMLVAGDIPDTGGNEAVDGTVPFPGAWTAFGVPIPPSPPNVTATLPPDTDVEDQRTVYYCFTNVNDRGEESAPSLPTEAVIISEAAVHVEYSLPLLGDINSGDFENHSYRPITHCRLYRLFAQDATQTWMFVNELSVANLSGTDTTPTAELDGDTLATFGWNPPPHGLRGLRTLPTGALVAFKGDEIMFSEPWYPYAWPVRYRYKCDSQIVGVGVFGSSVAVLTVAQPYVAVGNHPAEMSLVKLEADQACVSRRSIVDFGDRVVWASPDGLWSVGTNGAQSVTAAFMDKRTWREQFDKETIHAYAYEGLYVAFYGESAGFIINPFSPEEGLTDLSAYAYSAYRDMETDTLYLAMDEDGGYGVFAFDADAGNPITWEWRSRIFEFPAHVSLGRAQLLGTGYSGAGFEVDTYYMSDTGDITLRDDAVPITSRNPVTLRSGVLMTDWLVGMRGSGECEAILVGETIRDIRSQ